MSSLEKLGLDPNLGLKKTFWRQDCQKIIGKHEQFGGEAALIDPDLGLGKVRRKAMGGMMKEKRQSQWWDDEV